MTPSRRRVLLYAIATPVAGALLLGALWRPAADADTLASCAGFNLRIGLLDEAERQAGEALAQDPGHLGALLVDGACAEARGDAASACESYEKALASAPGEDLGAEIAVSLSLLESGLGRRERAEAHLRTAEAGPAETRSKAAYARAVFAAKFGTAEAAAAALAHAQLLAGKDARLATAIGERFAEIGNRDAALAAFAGAGGGGHPPALYAAARLKFAAGESEKGLTDLKDLKARNGAWLTRRMRQDAEFWAPLRECGDLPEGFLRAGDDGRGPRTPGPAVDQQGVTR